jgi:hypothetical protein
MPVPPQKTQRSITLGFLMVGETALPLDEIERRMNEGIRRALNTPPKPTKELVGKTERAKNQRESRELRARRAKPKSGEAS